MQQEKWIISVGCGRQQGPAILRCKELGYRVFGLDKDPNCKMRNHVDRFAEIDILDADACIKEIKKFRENYVAAASFIGEAGMITCGKIVDAFGLHGIGHELAIRMTNKITQMELWSSSNLPVPNTFVANNHASALQYLKNAKFPLIIKPADSAGSRGVYKIDSPDDECAKKIEESFSFSKSSKVLIQEFIHGQEYSVEGIMVDGTYHLFAISKRKVIHSTTAEEIYTEEIPDSLKEKIIQVTSNAHKALGYLEGLTHTELFVDFRNEVILIETAGRGGGFQVFDGLVSFVLDIDILEFYLRRLVGEEISLPHIEQRYHAILKFLPTEAGRIVEISGFDKLPNDNIRAEVLVSVGTVTRSTVSDGDRLGYILTRGKTTEIARRHLAEAMNSIKIKYLRESGDASHRYAPSP